MSCSSWRGALLGLLAPVALLSAQQVAPAAAPVPKPYDVTVDIGFVNVSGNRSLTTFAFGDKASYKSGLWAFSQQLSVVYSKGDGVVTAEFYRTQARTDFTLSPRLTVFGAVGWDRNRFAGIKRRTDENLGLAYTAIASPTDKLSIELGAGAVQQANLTGPVSNFGSGRGAASFKHSFSATAYATQFLEGISNFNTPADYRVNSETALVAPIASHIALKMSYVVRYQNAPSVNTAVTPAAPFLKTDFIFTSGLQITF